MCGGKPIGRVRVKLRISNYYCYNFRQITSGHRCIVLERFAAVRRVMNRSPHPQLQLSAPVDDYIIHCHPTGDDRKLLDAPSYYLIDQYLRAKAKTDFPRAKQCPVIVAGKYLNLTDAVPVS